MMSMPTFTAMPASTARGMRDASGAASNTTSISTMALTMPDKAVRPPD